MKNLIGIIIAPFVMIAVLIKHRSSEILRHMPEGPKHYLALTIGVLIGLIAAAVMIFDLRSAETDPLTQLFAGLLVTTTIICSMGFSVRIWRHLGYGIHKMEENQQKWYA